MARNVKTTKTPEQRRAEAEELQATIAEQVEALRESEAWARFLDFTKAFHRYSINNLLLIFGQCPEASHVAGYRTWQKLNRQVRKGERGIRIFGGRDVRETVENEQTGEEEEQRRVRFFPVSVFDMGQTDLIDEEAGDPADIARQLTGDDPAGIFDAVADYLTGKGWTVERESIPGGAHGYTDPEGRRVVLDSDLSPAQAAKTGLHEAAHVILHADEDHAEYVEHRGTKETEAESVAYIVAGILGLDTTAYSVGYVAGWSKCEAETIKATAANVLRTAHALADAITEPAPEPVAAVITQSNNASFAPFRMFDFVGFGVAQALFSQSPDPVAQEFARRLKEDFIDKGKLGVETREGFYHYDEQGNATGLTDAAKAAYPDFEG